MRSPGRRKASSKKAVHKDSTGGKAKGATLAQRIATAPRLVDPDLARAQVADWSAGLAPDDARLLAKLLSANPCVGTLLESLSESSPYLWELASSEPTRLLRLLQSDPDHYLSSFLAEHGRDAGSSVDAADAMRLLRRMKSEAALLIALADIGGVWPVMRAAHALTHLADTAVNAAVRFVLAEAERDGRLKFAGNTRSQEGSGYAVLAMGKMGAFELNYSSDIDLIVLYEPTAPALPADAEPSMLYVRLTQRLVNYCKSGPPMATYFERISVCAPTPPRPQLQFPRPRLSHITKVSGRTGNVPR